MACLNMFNSEHQGLCTPMSPRISFSNDFVETQQTIKHEHGPREAPVATDDFEFSVSSYSMMSADELFSKGRLLPFKDNCANQSPKMTLRDELLINDDEDVSPRPPKSPMRWKELLGLKSAHIVSKKADKRDVLLEVKVEGNGSTLVHEEMQLGKISQEVLSDGGLSCRDVEIGI